MSEQEGPGPAPGPGAPSEEELRAAYEAELSRITVTDMLAQSTVSLLNMAARRLAPGEAETGAGQDLEQVRDAIDGVRALLEILERRIPGEVRALRDALSQLQMAYAAQVGATPGAAPENAGPEGGPPPAEGDDKQGPGPAESSGRLWVPGR